MLKSLRAAALALAAGGVLLGGLQAAGAADTFYLGQWKITGATAAPWLAAGVPADDAEAKTLVGKTITLAADAIGGPGDFPCAKPNYEVIEGPAEMLFQGMFGQMHDENAAVDPQQLAEQAGFAGNHFRTVITGCEYEVDFSFGADDDTAMFALNNMLYTLKRQ